MSKETPKQQGEPLTDSGHRVFRVPRDSRQVGIDIKKSSGCDDDKITLIEYILRKENLTDGNEKEDEETKGSSRQGVTQGRKPHPFNFRAVRMFQTVNPHHSSCIKTKANATVGLGFRRPEESPLNQPLAQSVTKKPLPHNTVTTEETTDPEGKKSTKVTTVENKPNPEDSEDKKKIGKEALPPPDQQGPAAQAALKTPGTNPEATGGVLDPTLALIDRQMPSKADEVLDPLCEVTFLDVLMDAAEDYWQTGNGYIEVVREKNSDKITGIHHIPAEDVHIFIEDRRYHFHYEVENVGEDADWTRHFARFGDRDGMMKRGTGGFYGQTAPMETDKDRISEVIHFRAPSSLSRFYGFPDWLSAVTSIELIQALHQFKYDFFNNRGVPEFMFFLIGKKMTPDEWAKLENQLMGTIGGGNQHKTVVANIEASAQECKTEVHKLAMEGGKEDDFVKTKENLALDIVSAHRVPPLLAGIQIPGKLGANNELPNALMAFHVLVISQTQRLFRRILSKTLGNEKLNGGLGLKDEDFAFRTIVEEIDVGTLETVSRMRQDLRTARAEGRNLDEGVKD